MYSKYDFGDRGFLTFINHARELKFGKESHIMMIHDVKDDLVLQTPVRNHQATNMDFKEGGFLKHFLSC